MKPTQTFINTLSQTPALASSLKANLQRLQANLQQIIRYLTYPKTVADNLTKLSNALDLTSALLTFVSVIPEVGEAVIPLKNSITILKQEVTPAKNAAVNLENKVKPFREKLQQLEPVLARAIQTADTISTSSSAFLGKFTGIYDCVIHLPEGAIKEQSEQYLNQFSSQFQKPVEDLNTALGTSNTVIETFYSQLNSVIQALSPLAAISAAIDNVMNVLQPITSLLGTLQNALQSIKITIFLPYPIDISLYDIFEKFSAFADLALKPIQDLVNRLLAALHITLPSIPGLSDLIHLNINLPGLPDFSGIFQPITDALARLKAAFDMFHLDCPPK